MAIDLERAANAVSLSPALADRMRNVARGIDEIYWRLPHRVDKSDGGFVQPSHTHTLESILVIPRYTDFFGASYGHNATVRIANTVLLRYRQTGTSEHQRLILGAAAQYLDLDPDPDANRPDTALMALLAFGGGDMHAPETGLSILWTDH